MSLKGSLFRKLFPKREEGFLGSEILGIISIPKEQLKTDKDGYISTFDSFTIKSFINDMKKIHNRKGLFNKVPKLNSDTSSYRMLMSDNIIFVIITEEIVNNDLLVNNCTEFLQEIINEPSIIIQKIKEQDAKEFDEKNKEKFLKEGYDKTHVRFKLFILLKELKNMYIALEILFKDTDEITENHLKDGFQRTLETVRKNTDNITKVLNKQLTTMNPP